VLHPAAVRWLELGSNLHRYKDALDIWRDEDETRQNKTMILTVKNKIGLTVSADAIYLVTSRETSLRA
jgi:hypothetical protein